MRTILHFLILSLLLISISDFNVQASNSVLIEDKDEDGHFKMFREKPQDFTADSLRVFLRKADTLFPQEVKYSKNGQNSMRTIYKRYFIVEGYYFTFLTRHNLAVEMFLKLENVKLQYHSISNSGFQTKLHYKLYLGENEEPFSFRILYASKLKKELASTPLIHLYQKNKTNALVHKVVQPNSGDWKEALNRQAQIELQRNKRAEQKSEEAKIAIKQQYPSSSKALEPLELTTALPSAMAIEKKSSNLRKFSSHLLPGSAAKSLPKKVVLNTSAQTKAEIEQQYSSKKPYEDAPLQRKGSRILIEEKRKHEKDFQDKKEVEECVDSIERRASITPSGLRSEPKSPRTSPDRFEQSQGSGSESLLSSLRSNTNQKLVSLAEKETLETFSDSFAETEYSEVSQTDIDELFEDESGSE